MNKLTYTEIKRYGVRYALSVLLDGKLVGHIKAVTERGVKQFAYFPKGAGVKFRGDLYPTEADVKTSLRGCL